MKDLTALEIKVVGVILSALILGSLIISCYMKQTNCEINHSKTYNKQANSCT